MSGRNRNYRNKNNIKCGINLIDLFILFILLISSCKIICCRIGKILIIAAALEEIELGEILKKEGKEINEYLKNIDDFPYEINDEDIIEANKNIQKIICCIAKLEEKILEKIKLGVKLLDKSSCASFNYIYIFLIITIFIILIGCQDNIRSR